MTSCGRDHTYEAAPEQVLVGTPTSVETLVALGVEDAVVGYTSGDFGPPPVGAEAVTEISPAYYAPREAILAAEPDLFLVNNETQVSGEEGTVGYDDIDRAGANVYVLGDYCLDAPGSTGIASVYHDVEALGEIFGVPDRAGALVEELQDRVEDAAALGGDAEPLRAAFVQVFDGDLYAGSGSVNAMVLDALGLENVFTDLEENFAQISPEEVLVLDAEVLVFVYDFAGDEEEARAEVEALLATTPAVQDGLVIGVPSHLTEGFGVSVVDIVELVADGVYG